MDRRGWAKFGAAVVLSVLVLGAFSVPLGVLAPLGSLLDPTAGLWSVAEHARHPRDAQVLVPGLSAPVTILRDKQGVPYIYAATAEDGWFGVGYAHAQDRLWQMDVQYRAGAGRLSEVYGSDFVSTDEFFRTIGLNRIAQSAIAEREAAGEFDLAVMRAYAAGVNAYIASTPRADLPLEFKLLGYAPEPWSPEKALVEGGLIAYGLAVDFSDLQYGLLVEKLGQAAVDQLFPEYPAGTQNPIMPRSVSPTDGTAIARGAALDILRKARLAETFAPHFDGAGSNNWAVSGARTSTGKPLLAADPHLRFQLPALWYMVELHAGPYQLRGATFPGIPGVFFGTNGYIAWGETNTGADVNDFYIERFSADRRQYFFDGSWQNVAVRRETIGVRGGEPVTIDVLETVHGPVITESGQTVAMKSAITLFGQELKAMLLVNQAHNWTAFREGLRWWRVPAQNFVYADANGAGGNIALRSNGHFPIRNNTLGRGPLNGSSGAYEWIGWVPIDSYPEVVNPAQGYVASANQVPYPPTYPYYLGSLYDPGYRARRIDALLAADSNVTLGDMGSFQLDQGDEAARAVVPYLLAAVTARPGNAVDQAAIDALATWDYVARADSTAETVWWTFHDVYLRHTYGDEYRAGNASELPLPQFNTLEDLTRRDRRSPWFDNASTIGTVEDRDAIIRESFEANVDALAADLGPDVSRWTWRSIHAREFDHLTGLVALSRGPYPCGGDSFTLNVAGGLLAKGGPSWRQLIDFSDLNNSVAIYPGGQSGNPLSPHYADLLPRYLDGVYMPFEDHPNPADLSAGSIEAALRLVPG